MLISVVIVNWNTKELLRQTVSSLVASTALPLEVIVVDNASTDGSIEMVSSDFPEVVHVVNTENLGFGKANNQGMARAKGEYIFLLNSDTIVHDGAVDILYQYLQTHDTVGMVGPKLLNADGTFQYACRRRLPHPLNSLIYLSGIGKLFPKSKRLNSYKQQAESPDVGGSVEAISGAAMLFRRVVYEATGGFDERFFMYGEDLDLCKTVQDKGFLIHYVPTSVITHLGGQSSKKSRLKSLKNFYHAMWLYYDKHWGQKHVWPFRLLVYMGIWVVFGVACVKNFTKSR